MTNNKQFLQILRHELCLEQDDLNSIGQILDDYALTVGTPAYLDSLTEELEGKLQKVSDIVADWETTKKWSSVYSIREIAESGMNELQKLFK